MNEPGWKWCPPHGDASISRDLALVIPAYKARFLDEALGSIAAQDSSGFQVYIGDDASPEDLASVCRRWEKEFPLNYHRFERNLGEHDLVAQWERCIALSNEPWIWLFGDDDVMEPGCVRAWRDAAVANPQAELFHFDVLRIDAQSRPLCDEPAFPPRLSARRFLLQRLCFQISSYAPDFIFSRGAYEAVGGFQQFPLAWGSDDATWTKLAARGGGIRSVPGARIHWRLSGSNISSRNGDPGRAASKLEASVQILEWIESILAVLPKEQGDPDDDDLRYAGRRWLYLQAKYVDAEFWKLGLLPLVMRLRKLPFHGTVGSIMRMIKSDWRAVNRRLKSRPPAGS
jgi:glycosyltransferase involved in cell wall biosynthesis